MGTELDFCLEKMLDPGDRAKKTGTELDFGHLTLFCFFISLLKSAGIAQW